MNAANGIGPLGVPKPSIVSTVPRGGADRHRTQSAGFPSTKTLRALCKPQPNFGPVSPTVAQDVEQGSPGPDSVFTVFPLTRNWWVGICLRRGSLECAPRPRPSAPRLQKGDDRHVAASGASPRGTRRRDLGRRLKNAKKPTGVCGIFRTALDTYSVVVLRDQRLTPQDQVDFTLRLGPPMPTTFSRFAPENSDVRISRTSSRRESASPNAGSASRTDQSYLRNPDIYSLLYALEIARRPRNAARQHALRQHGGRTTPYPRGQTGSQENRCTVSPVLEEKEPAGNDRDGYHRRSRRVPRAKHPVRTHPHGPGVPVRIRGAHAEHRRRVRRRRRAPRRALRAPHYQPQFIYAHSWRVGDLIVLGQLRGQHKAIRITVRAGGAFTTDVTGPVPF